MLVKIEDQLKELIVAAVKELYDLDLEDVIVEIPRNTDNGDYSTNTAMLLPRRLHKAPQEIANQISEKLAENTDLIKSVEVAGPGFINFRIQPEHLSKAIKEALEKKENFGNNYSGNRKPILVEYVSANPTGDLHLGHARNAAWGDCICRLLKASNWDVLREYYINNAGNQMVNLAKSVYARYAQYFGKDVQIPEDGYFAEDVKKIGEDIAKEVGDQWLDKEEGRLEFFMQRGYEEEMAKIERDLKYFRCEFDSWISEKSLYDSPLIEETLQKMADLGLTYETDGALWFKTTNYGDDKDRVLRKSDGNYTYFTPDIANHMFKFYRGYNELVNLWGGDHHSYVDRMYAAMDALGHKGELTVDLIQMVHLVENGEEVKMSKRSGTAITIRNLCDAVGVDVARYFFASHAIESQMDFDLGLAKKNSNENPVYYVQYAHARACGILKNSPWIRKQSEYHQLTSDSEVNLMKIVYDFPFVVAKAAEKRRPNQICHYLMNLASQFHSYYGQVKINDPENPELTNERLALVKAVEITIKNALALIGVSAPETM